MSDMKKGNDLFLTEEQVILGVIDEAWQRETLPDDTLVFSGANHQSLLSNDILDTAENERKEKDEKEGEKWNHHGLEQYT